MNFSQIKYQLMRPLYLFISIYWQLYCSSYTCVWHYLLAYYRSKKYKRVTIPNIYEGQLDMANSLNIVGLSNHMQNHAWILPNIISYHIYIQDILWYLLNHKYLLSCLNLSISSIWILDTSTIEDMIQIIKV